MVEPNSSSWTVHPATYNFILSELVRKMGIPIETTTKAYGVLLGTGSLQGAEICKQVTVCLEYIEILEDFLPFDLSFKFKHHIGHPMA